MRKSHPHPSTPSSSEALYAAVNKQPKRGNQRILSPEEVQAESSRHPTSADQVVYTDIRKREYNAQRFQQQEDPPYNTPRPSTRNYDIPSPRPLETVYAPQRPQGNPYDSPGRMPGNGQRANKLANPYEVVDLATGEREVQQRENSLYDLPSGSTQDLRSNPQNPEQHLYAELEFGTNRGHSPQKPLESVYATVGATVQDRQGFQQQVNPLYDGIGRATTPPPRTTKDLVTTKLLQHVDIQYGVREIQERCKIVYGKEHALNEPLAKIIDNPRNAEQVLWDLAENPEGPGKLAGSKILGVKSPDRKAAEDEFRHLCSALEKHIYQTQKLYKAFTREHTRDQKQEGPERNTEHSHHHSQHHRHAKGRSQESPEHSPQQRKHESSKGMAYAM
ncbi:hypothetical protein GGR08_001163 [Bartonella fuyuanensis]|uniref:Uncharacterized protein n=1 Tax=Bartonella fuyuanensis TaxID=1460968 RepID=A0A840DZC6_9HYPH|nr:BID domain-containing T4SS effector [Bartonella fuyuanensis]MBB4076852.1 hypothetical protein [Bartonella fuyuanensis]